MVIYFLGEELLNKNNLTVIILAAGKGTRMQSNLPKVLHTINNKPMLQTVIDTSLTLAPKKILIVVGYKKELVIEKIKRNNIITYINQKEQKGTGDAIKQCLKEIAPKENVLILSGDVPLISSSTLKNFIHEYKKNKSNASLISTNLTDPSGYGRIIRENQINLLKIVEHKDANKKELNIKEINSGIYLIKSQIIIDKISLIKSNNAQGEYYLTDIFNFIDSEETNIYNTNNHLEISGINTLEQLQALEKEHNE